jgi:hypothetical protein
MLELRRDLNLALEPFAVHTRGKLGREDLDDHLATECVLGRREHTTHPTTGQLIVDPVGRSERCSEAIAERVGHGVRSIGGSERERSWKLRERSVTRNAMGRVSSM